MHNPRHPFVIILALVLFLLTLSTAAFGQSSPEAPVIDRVEVFQDANDSAVILQRIYFRDPDSNANLVDFDLVSSTLAGIRPPDGMLPPGRDQTVVDYHEMRWNCAGDIYDATVTARLLDRSGNESNAVEYTLRCGQRNDFVIEGVAPAQAGEELCAIITERVVNARLQPNTSAEPLPNGLQPGAYLGVAVTTGSDGFNWYQLEFGYWVREDIVSVSPGCAALDDPPPTAAPISTTAPTSIAVPTVTPAPTAVSATGTSEFCIETIDALASARTNYSNGAQILGGFDVGSADSKMYLCQIETTCDGLNQANTVLDGYYYEMSAEDGVTMVNAALSALASCFPEAAALVDASSPAAASLGPAFAEGAILVAVRAHSGNPATLAMISANGERHNYDLGAGLENPQSPAWSADGQRIAFSAQTIGGTEDIYVMNADGTGLRNLTSDSFVNDRNPVWSPGSDQIAYIAAGESSADVHLVYLNGPFRQITRGGFVMDVAWSPDGGALAYSVRRLDDGSLDIYATEIDGGTMRNVTNSPGDDLDPQWSPDGRQIAFTSFRDGTPRVYVMDAIGTNVQLVSPADAFARHPGWSADGSQLAFDLQRSGDNTEIYTANADGTNLQPLPVLQDYRLSDPAWRPDGVDRVEVVFSLDNVPLPPTSTPRPTVVQPTSTRAPATPIPVSTPVPAGRERVVIEEYSDFYSHGGELCDYTSSVDVELQEGDKLELSVSCNGGTCFLYVPSVRRSNILVDTGQQFTFIAEYTGWYTIELSFNGYNNGGWCPAGGHALFGTHWR